MLLYLDLESSHRNWTKTMSYLCKSTSSFHLSRTEFYSIDNRISQPCPHLSGFKPWSVHSFLLSLIHSSIALSIPWSIYSCRGDLMRASYVSDAWLRAKYIRLPKKKKSNICFKELMGAITNRTAHKILACGKNIFKGNEK